MVDKKHTVLLVEDEEDLREGMRDALEFNGYSVVAAEDGQAALDQLGRTDHVCVVLLDLLMPGMNGWDFFAKLRSLPAYATIPVVVHSSAPSRAPLGATRVLQKPVKLEQLLAVVREFCAG
jgi:two-component system, chemotaxis family, chemotaxis protein CheY